MEEAYLTGEAMPAAAEMILIYRERKKCFWDKKTLIFYVTKKALGDAHFERIITFFELFNLRKKILLKKDFIQFCS